MTTPPDSMNASTSDPLIVHDKKKKKYSKKFKEGQKAERELSKATRRMANAVLAGVDRWNDARDRSAEKKKDGSIKDFNKNMAKAVSKALKVSAKVPEDMARAVDKLIPKRLRLFR